MVTERNRIFLNANQHLPFRQQKDGKGVCRDGSAFPFLIEQFVAIAVTDIFLPTVYEKYSVGLPKFIQRRISYIETKDSIQRTLAVLRPVFEEFRVFSDDNGEALIIEDRSIDTEIVASIHTLQAALIDFFCAAENRLFVDIHLPGLLTSIMKLRIIARQLDTRMTLACLNGVFSTYRREEVDSVILLPPSSDRRASVFHEFVEDALYQEMSEVANKAGYPGLSRMAIPKLRRLVKEFASKPPFKQITDLSLKTLSVVTGAPILGADSINDAIKTDFLPPVTSFQPEIRRGLTYWQEMEPEFFSPGRRKEDYEDWSSIKGKPE